MSVEPVVCWQNGCNCLGSRVTCHRQRHAIHGCPASTAELAGTELTSVIHPTLTAQMSSWRHCWCTGIAFAAAAAEIGIPISHNSVASFADNLAYSGICLLVVDIGPPAQLSVARATKVGNSSGACCSPLLSLASHKMLCKVSAVTTRVALSYLALSLGPVWCSMC